MKAWIDAHADDGWTPGGKDVKAALVGGSITMAQLHRDARHDRVLLGKCATRDELTMGDAHNYRAQSAVIGNDTTAILQG